MNENYKSSFVMYKVKLLIYYINSADYYFLTLSWLECVKKLLYIEFTENKCVICVNVFYY